MGYTTEFIGKFELNKELEPELREYINRFSYVRHMKRDNEKIKEIFPEWKKLCYKGELGIEGEYFVMNSECFGQENTKDILDYNQQPRTQPGLWCQWIIPEDDYATIVWDGGEKFYSYVEWLEYLIENFLKPNGYIVNGTVYFDGEAPQDAGSIIVKDNVIDVIYGPIASLYFTSDEVLLEECKRRNLIE